MNVTGSGTVRPTAREPGMPCASHHSQSLVAWAAVNASDLLDSEPMSIPIVDLFAGPGGLNEGFSSLTGEHGVPVFETVGSFEMDAAACNTLTLRATYRRARQSSRGLATYYQVLRREVELEEALLEPTFLVAWQAAQSEVHRIELGPTTRSASNRIIGDALASRGVSHDTPWVLVGGPPCQAYSLAGRSRRTNDERFEDDKKHFLYREYLNILAKFRPPIFVMENVKGLLSSTHSGSGMFDRILRDLAAPSRAVRYSIHSFTVSGDDQTLEPEDFIIRAEDFGVPQRRHRVILLGIRHDLDVGHLPKLQPRRPATVQDAIGDLPPLRSGLSRADDDLAAWVDIRDTAAAQFHRKKRGRPRTVLSRGSEWQPYSSTTDGTPLHRWLSDPHLHGISQHATRRHMADDLTRYWFAANFALTHGYSPKLGDFPGWLLPHHVSAKSDARPFEDRFRVQLWNRPSTTVVSHISKDGHYYIHPDPDQMRSLTVREAARLQTFPDNYLFMGNRTSQFVQVGNAVPPYLARQIAGIVRRIFDEC